MSFLFASKSPKRVVYQVGSNDYSSLAAATKKANEYAKESYSDIEIIKVTSWFDGRSQYPKFRETVIKRIRGKLREGNPGLLSKLKKGIRGHIKLKGGKLIIKT